MALSDAVGTGCEGSPCLEHVTWHYLFSIPVHPLVAPCCSGAVAQSDQSRGSDRIQTLLSSLLAACLPPAFLESRNECAMTSFPTVRRTERLLHVLNSTTCCLNSTTCCCLVLGLAREACGCVEQPATSAMPLAECELTRMDQRTTPRACNCKGSLYQCATTCSLYKILAQSYHRTPEFLRVLKLWQNRHPLLFEPWLDPC
jgi:hypothetical protein